jgi:hypothetical protein
MPLRCHPGKSLRETRRAGREGAPVEFFEQTPPFGKGPIVFHRPFASFVDPSEAPKPSRQSVATAGAIPC